MNVRLSEMKKIIKDFAADFQQGSSALVITLSGDLGAGKTTFTQFLAEVLGVTETVTSPTFVIQKEYSTDHSWIKKMIHIDAYRLENQSDLEYLGWSRLASESQNVIILEWPEMVDGIDFPDNLIKIHISINDDHTRKISIT